MIENKTEKIESFYQVHFKVLAFFCGRATRIHANVNGVPAVGCGTSLDASSDSITAHTKTPLSNKRVYPLTIQINNFKLRLNRCMLAADK